MDCRLARFCDGRLALKPEKACVDCFGIDQIISLTPVLSEQTVYGLQGTKFLIGGPVSIGVKGKVGPCSFGEIGVQAEAGGHDASILILYGQFKVASVVRDSDLLFRPIGPGPFRRFMIIS